MKRVGIGARGVDWIGFGLLVVLFAVDLYLDTRERDVFSWMDPYQYYEFGVGVLEGSRSFDQFEIPSIFPFFLMPLLVLAPSIPGALWISFAALLLLLWAIHRLCAELGVKTPSPLVALLVLSSPILIGLSRTLYVEFTLTAIASAAFLHLLRFTRTADATSGLAFGCLVGLGFLTKTTFPVFVVPPVAGAVLGRLAERRDAEAVKLVAAATVPVVLAVSIHVWFFSPSLGYYLNLASTQLPFMHLMGPPETWSWASATYYFREVGRIFLCLLTPLLVFTALADWRRVRGLRLADLASPRAALWLWFLGPLVLLIAHPLKEPRHVTTCVVPGVLLLVLGIESLPSRAMRRGLVLLALLLAGVQFAAVTSKAVDSPYFMDRSLHYEALRKRMIETAGREIYAATPQALRMMHWSYNQNVAVAGFPGNEALALAWQGFPGVVFDLDTFDRPERFSDEIPFEQFEDLYFLAAINIYNRRCGWTRYYGTLSREEVVANADFVILNGSAAESWSDRFPEHELVATVRRDAGPIRILRARRATTPYRTLYARKFLDRHPALDAAERRVVAREMLMAAVLRGDEAAVVALLREFPILRDPNVEMRNIYWITSYPSIIRLAGQRMAQMSRAAVR